MAKVSAEMMMMMMIGVMALESASAQPTWNPPAWYHTNRTRRGSSLTNLQFYFHDTFTGPDPSAVRVAEAQVTNVSTTMFGSVMITDNPLTQGVAPTSKLVGRAQGLCGSVGQREVAFLSSMNMFFTDGTYNGSSISILGRNTPMNYISELPVVGGTGLFRYAHGYAMVRTRWVNTRTGDAIFWFNVTVFH